MFGKLLSLSHFLFFFLNHDEKIILEVFMKLTSKTFFLCHLEFFDIKKNY